VARVRIAVRDLSKTFNQGPREVPAVSGVSFDVHDREFVAVVGPSGCGKSSLMKLISGLHPPAARQKNRNSVYLFFPGQNLIR